MRLLGDENCTRSVVDLLRRVGHDVAWIREDGAGAADRDVLARAHREGRTLLTFDKGFGELVFRDRAPVHAGVLLFRLEAGSPEVQASRVADALRLRRSWKGLFATVTDAEVRVRRIRA